MELFGEGASDLFTIETWRALPGSGKESLLADELEQIHTKLYLMLPVI